MLSYGGIPGEAQFKEEARLPSWFSTVVCQGWWGRGLLETSEMEIFEANCLGLGLHGEDWGCSELKWNYSIRAWILRWVCGRPVILRWNFSLLRSGVRKWSDQTWARWSSHSWSLGRLSLKLRFFYFLSVFFLYFNFMDFKSLQWKRKREWKLIQLVIFLKGVCFGLHLSKSL